MNTFGLKASLVYRFPLGEKEEERLEFRLSLLGATTKQKAIGAYLSEAKERYTISSQLGLCSAIDFMQSVS